MYNDRVEAIIFTHIKLQKERINLTPIPSNVLIPSGAVPILQTNYMEKPLPEGAAPYCGAIQVSAVHDCLKQPVISDFKSGLDYESCACTITISELPLFSQMAGCHGFPERQELLRQSVFGSIVRAHQQLFEEGDTAGKSSYKQKARSGGAAFVQNSSLRFRFSYLMSYSEDAYNKHATVKISLLWSGNKSYSTIRHNRSEKPRVMDDDSIRKHASLVYEALHSDIAAFIKHTHANAATNGTFPDYYSAAQPGIIPDYYKYPAN